MIASESAGYRTADIFAGLEHSHTAIVFADVVDSVRLMDRDEMTSVRRWLDFVDQLVAEMSQEDDGRLVKRMGDGLLLEFSDISEAIRTAFLMQDRLDELNRNVAREDRIEIRIGVDTGNVLRGIDQDLYGRHVNIAARLATAAEPGQILATAEARDAMAGELDAEFEDLGEFYLKNLAGKIRAFRVLRKGASPRVSAMLRVEDFLPTVAVIPFRAFSVDRDNQMLGELMAEDLIVALSHSALVNVTSRLSTTGFRNRSYTLEDIRTSLNADFVVSGIYMGDSTHVKLDLELAEVRTGKVIWSQRLSDDIANTLRSQSGLSELAQQIHRAILNTEMNRALSDPLPTLEGYALLMAAVSLMHRLSTRDFAMAETLLNELIYRFPNTPVPLAWKARWHVLKVQQGWSEDPMREASIAMDCTRRALDLDVANVPALIAEGFVQNNLLKDLDAAEENFDRALDLNPNDATGRLLRGTLYTFRGEGDAAVRECERAIHLAPLEPHRFFFFALAAGASIAAEDYPRALELAQSSLRLNRGHTSTLRIKSVAQWRLGDEEGARRTARTLMQLQPDLSVSKWLETAPSAAFPVGRFFAQTLGDVGIPK